MKPHGLASQPPDFIRAICFKAQRCFAPVERDSVLHYAANLPGRDYTVQPTFSRLW